MIVVGFRKIGLRSKKMMRLANQKDKISSILMTEAIPVTRVSIGGDWGVGIPLMPNLRGEDDHDDDDEYTQPGGDEADEELICHPCEGAPKPVTGRDPRCPTAQERADHDFKHLSFLW